MIDVANRHGYADAPVSAVIDAARVSRPTFYEYFADRDSCFDAAIEDVQSELLLVVQATVDDAAAHQAMAVAVGSIVEYASAEPARARFLMGGAMAGAERSRSVRDSGIARIAAAVDRALNDAPANSRCPDIETRLVIASIYRMIATRLRRGEASISPLSGELLDWLAGYERPKRSRRWQVLKPGRAPARSPHVPDAPIQPMPELFPPGRTRIPEREIAENHRLRILHAASQLAAEKGFAATRVADIVKLARVDGGAFYGLFSDKQEAFAAAHEIGFQRVIDVTAKAFFAAEGWPQRSWEAAQALTQLLQANPLVACVGFVEAYAIGPATVQRIEDSSVAFMFFLQEGLVHPRDDSPPSRVSMEAIVAAIFEIVYIETRRGEESRIASMLAQIAHLWLTPFMGVAEADAFIDAHVKTRPAK